MLLIRNEKAEDIPAGYKVNEAAFGRRNEAGLVDAQFGFVPARSKGLACEYEVPDDVFILVELTPGALNGMSGLVKYRPEFSLA
jgi:predicted N-acetyltransferase YhbS